MPPLESALITGGMFILLEGVIITNMNQIQFIPRQARCMGWRPSLLLFVLIDTVTVVHSASYMFKIDGSTGIAGNQTQNLTVTITSKQYSKEQKIERG